VKFQLGVNGSFFVSQLQIMSSNQLNVYSQIVSMSVPQLSRGSGISKWAGWVDGQLILHTRFLHSYKK